MKGRRRGEHPCGLGRRRRAPEWTLYAPTEKRQAVSRTNLQKALAWRHLQTRAGTARHLTSQEISQRAYKVSRVFEKARLVEGEAFNLERRSERILPALVRERAKEEEIEQTEGKAL